MSGMSAFQQMLDGLRHDFLCQLSERCDSMDSWILRLVKSPGDREVFHALYRVIHSLKGVGGTHGLAIITAICHQLENVLCEADERHCFDETFSVRALKFVDLLRAVEVVARQEEPDFSVIEAALHEHRKLTLQHRKPVMIADSSKMMTGLYQHVLASLPLQVTSVDAGLQALERLLIEPFELLIIGRELKALNGLALIAALRASNSRNREIPVLLITSGTDAVPEHLHVNCVVHRNQTLSSRLLASAAALLNIEAVR
jgi:chemotaxis protein histidine kinase CheA